MNDPSEIYAERPMSAGYPNIDELYHEQFVGHLEGKSRDIPAETRNIVKLLGRAVDLDSPKDFCVVGCGPRPGTIVGLAGLGHRVKGVEPIPSYVETANEFLDGAAEVVEGVAEELPFEDASFDVLFFESVFEHVDSPPRCLDELYRVLRPGGILYLTTTNRFRFRISGKNGEFTTPFYNWFPRLVKESYVHQTLHYQPSLANYSVRPAVHWFCYSDLCRLGRDAQFAVFYSLFDLMRPDDHERQSLKGRARAFLVNAIHRSPWVRSLALVQKGYAVVMLKRPAPGEGDESG